MSYDIDKYGKTKNVTAIYCSNEIFAQPSIRAVSKWTYYPKMVNGVDVETRNKVTYHSYFLTDEAGNHIKNQDGYPNFDKNGKHLSEHICAEFIV